MNNNATCCTQDDIEAFLAGNIDESTEQAFSEHFDECEPCQQLLESLAAEEQSWSEARQFLKRDPELTESGDAAPRQARHVLESLKPTDDPQMLGRLGGYEVSGVVGVGGMGVVLKAQDPSLDRTVAVKVLAPHLASSSAARNRFAREAKAAAAVLHPNVIAIHGVTNDDDLPWLVMPYIKGPSLQKRIRQEAPLPPAEILRIGAQIAAGLAAAHSHGLVHRDIKPANILLEDGVERVTITDFGLARAVDDATMTKTGEISGTPQYMSPEQSRGDSIDARSDQFSLGCVMYELCTGRAPFRAETTLAVLRRIAEDEPRSILDLNPEIPTWLCNLISRMMAKDADQRFGDCDEISKVLEECLAHVQQPEKLSLPAVATQQPPRAAQRAQSNWLGLSSRSAFAVTCVLALIMLSAGWLVRSALDGKSTSTGAESTLGGRARSLGGDEFAFQVDRAMVGGRVSSGDQVHLVFRNPDRELVTTTAKVLSMMPEFTRDPQMVLPHHYELALNLDELPLGMMLKEAKLELVFPSELRDKSVGQSRFIAVSNMDGEPSSWAEESNTLSRSLSDVVDGFNEKYREQAVERGWALLTVEEVVAALRWARSNGQMQFLRDNAQETYDQLEGICEQRVLPANWKLEGKTELQTESGQKINVWAIRLAYKLSEKARRNIGIAGGTILIRQQYSGVESEMPMLADKKNSNIRSVPLEALVADFNRRHSSKDGIRQTPLTADEVAASIQHAYRPDSPLSKIQWEEFQSIATNRAVPSKYQLTVGKDIGEIDGIRFRCWSVRLVCDTAGVRLGGTWEHVVRNQFLSSWRSIDGKISWGEVADNGIQLGVRFVPDLAEYEAGTVVDTEFLIRNMSDEAIEIGYPKIMSSGRLAERIAVDEKGHLLGYSELGLTTPPGWYERSLDAGGMVSIPGSRHCLGGEVKEVQVPMIQVAPGKLGKLTFVIRNPAKGENKKLSTGTIEFRIKAKDRSHD